MSKKKKSAKKSGGKTGDWKKRQAAEPTPLEMAAEEREEEAQEVQKEAEEVAEIEASEQEEDIAEAAPAKKSKKKKGKGKRKEEEEVVEAAAEQVEEDAVAEESATEESATEESSYIENNELNLEFAEEETEGFSAESAEDEEERIATEEEVEGTEDEEAQEQAMSEELAGTELASFESAQIEDIETISPEQIRSVVESVLFTTDKPISIALIKQVFKGTQVKSKDIREALEAMIKEYDESPQRGFTLQEISGGFQLRTKVENNKYLKETVKARPFKLSGPALEVMSIVAYKQPCTKSQIDEIRGVESGHLLRALMEKHLVSFGERSELPGKPMFYETTRKFLEIFGLRNIAELPSLHEIDQLIPEGIGGDEPKKEKLSDLTGQLSTEVADGSSYSVGEEELLKITDELSTITTSSDFFEQEKQRMREKRDADRAQDIRERQIVGEEIDPKDLRWLERYETAKAEGAAQAEDVDFVTEGMDNANIPTSTDEAPFSEEVMESSIEMTAESMEASEEPKITEESTELLADAHEELEPTEREPEQEI